MSINPMYYTLIPLISISAFFIICFAIYSIKVALYGLPNRYDRERLKEHPLIGVFLTEYWMWVISPVENFLLAIKVSANFLTFLTLIISIAAAVAITLGHFGLGGWLVLFGSTFDLIDGRIARAQGQSGPPGAFFDSVIDRYSELVVFAGFALYYRSSLLFMGLALFAVIGTVMVSYTRARGEGLGVVCSQGMMQRAERALYIGLGAALDPILTALLEPGIINPKHYLVLFVFIIVGIGTNLTAIRRFTFIYSTLKSKQK